MWHDDENKRKQHGDELEKLFAKQVRCSCVGKGKFIFIGDRYPGCPDFTCEYCGQLVDVKNSPQAEQTGNISVSAKPWSGYPDQLLLVTKISGKWIGEYKRFIHVQNRRPYKPTHAARATEFYLISWKPFQRLTTLGYLESRR